MKRHLLSLVVWCFAIAFCYAQDSNYDIILKTNGEEMEGNVKEIGDDALKFVYKNESIEYNVAESDIVKITFGSGRVQFFNKFDTGGGSKQSEGSSNKARGEKKYANLEDHHNKVAILPFAYLRDDQDGSKTKSNKIQNEAFSLYNKNKASLSFLPPQTTNALLIKAGISNNNIEGFTMGEICNVLGVEYVIQGMISIEKTNQTNISNSSSTTRKTSNKPYVDRRGRIIGDIWGNGKRKTSSSSVSTNIQNYSTSMTINIYNDRGDSIFSQDHSSFWQTQDAYKITLKYLTKRSPLFKR
ncbi:hypothetical protein [Maribacter sp. 2308TA10-17]|uniref:hypothetical protein n=1 Tax=Maribacter sp. 2308TA10-17 TaxID=3386276 RepID=UPI0039BD3CBA